MPRYDVAKDDPDGRGLARRLAAMQQATEEQRRPRAGQVTDPTPPPVDVSPGTLPRALLDAGQETS